VTYYGLSYTETGEGGNGRTQQLKRLAVLSLAEELNAMGDCDFSEWCRRSKSLVPPSRGLSVCGVAHQPRPSTSLDNQESGNRPNCAGTTARQLVWVSGWVASIRHCDAIRPVQSHAGMRTTTVVLKASASLRRIRSAFDRRHPTLVNAFSPAASVLSCGG
jgi:hypothetical protein